MCINFSQVLDTHFPQIQRGRVGLGKFFDPWLETNTIPTLRTHHGCMLSSLIAQAGDAAAY
jgi:hypothetical protein